MEKLTRLNRRRNARRVTRRLVARLTAWGIDADHALRMIHKRNDREQTGRRRKYVGAVGGAVVRDKRDADSLRFALSEA